MAGERESTNGFRAIDSLDSSVREISIADTSVRNDESWFSEACEKLIGTIKAGFALHIETGIDERSCRRYAADHARPSAWFFRKLLRGKNGWQWLNAAMDGADPPWWREVQRAKRVAAAIEREMRS